MTNEKRLETLYNLARTTSGDLYPVEDMIKNPAQFDAWQRWPILSDFAALILDTLAKMDRQTTPAATLAALKRITDTDEKTRGAYTDRDGWHIIGSPWAAVRSREAYPASIPERTPEQGNPPDFSRIFSDAEAAHVDYIEFTSDELPTLAELKAHCAAHGMRRNKRGGKPYVISTTDANDKPQNIGVSPYLLQDLRDALPDAKLYHAGPADLIHAIDPESGDLIGLLCPVRVAKQDAAENVA